MTMARFADDLAALLDALEVHEPIVFCGLSMGGYIAFPFVRKYADRLQGLILCDTRAAADAPATAEGRLTAADRVLREGPKSLVDAMLPRLLAKTTCECHPYLVEQLRRTMMSASPHGIARGAARHGRAARRDGFACRHRLPDVGVGRRGGRDYSAGRDACDGPIDSAFAICRNSGGGPHVAAGESHSGKCGDVGILGNVVDRLTRSQRRRRLPLSTPPSPLAPG